MTFFRQMLATVCSPLGGVLLTAAFVSSASAQVLVTPADDPATLATESASSLPPPDEPILTNNVESADAAAVLPAETEPNLSPDVATRVDQALASEPRRFHYTLELTVQGIYDDNVNLQPSDHLSDFYFSIDPRLVFGFGDVVAKT